MNFWLLVFKRIKSGDCESKCVGRELIGYFHCDIFFFLESFLDVAEEVTFLCAFSTFVLKNWMWLLIDLPIDVINLLGC